MIGGGVRAGVFLVAAFVFATAAVASAEPSSRLDGKLSKAETELSRQEAEIDRTLGDLIGLGARLEEAQERANSSAASVEKLRKEKNVLSQSLESQRRDAADSRTRFKERLVAAYRGQQLDAVVLLLDNLFGDSSEGETANTMAARMLASDRESMRLYRQDRVVLGDTIRQLEQKQEEYDGLWREHRARVEEYERHEAALEDSIRALRQERGETEAGIGDLRGRIARLEARRLEARKEVDRSNPPASGGGEGSPEEARIASDDIVAEPVGTLPLARYRRLYQDAAEDYGFGPDWYVLMAIGKLESNHGENMGPSSAGALGPMQFMPSTWDSAGVDGNGDGVANVMDPEDAIPAAAGYLAAAGAPEDWYSALYAYNGAGWYVDEVLEVAEQYRLLAGDDSVGPYGVASSPARAPSAPGSPEERPISGSAPPAESTEAEVAPERRASAEEQTTPGILD